MSTDIKIEEKKLEKGFFGFWVSRYKVSYLAIFLLIISGLFSLFTIPKETSPDIKFGIISITTSYPGVSPTDMDSLITEKIEGEIEDIDGVKKINSTSSVGFSSTLVELKTGVDTRDVLTDIKDSIDKLDLPDDANDTSVVEISTSSDLIFEVLLYGDENKFSSFDLTQKAQFIKNNIEGKIPGLSSIELSSMGLKMGLKSKTKSYEIQVLIDKNKIEQIGLSLFSISDVIKSFNKNTPVGNYTIGNLDYDFRFDGELTNIKELGEIVIKSDNSSKVRLKDISTIRKKYSDKSIRKLGFKDSSGYNYVSLLFSKSDGANIFSVAKNSKKALKELFKNNSELKDLGSFYVKDMSELILEDYKNLGNTAVQTLILVFVIIFLFVGFKESLIASLLLPLSFFITFIVLNTFGYSLNFLTNFSLVLTLGIAIDTVIVIIEGASEKQKLGYNKKMAVLLSIKDFHSPLISGTLTTLSAFLPLIFLPGIMGKFLSYIPITVFATLLAALVLSLTVSSALYMTFAKNRKTFHKDEKFEGTLTEKQRQFLELERIGKKEKSEEKLSIRDKVLDKISSLYYNYLIKKIKVGFFRFSVIFFPFLLLVLSFIFLAPKIGFTLFPQTDNAIMSGNLIAKVGTDQKILEKYLKDIDSIISKIPELKVYNSNLKGNKISVYIELEPKKDRQKKGLRMVFDVEKELISKFKKFESDGLKLNFEALKEGPPTGKATGIELIAENANDFLLLKSTAEDLKDKFEKINGTKNVALTSSDSPGQFIFRFDKSKLTEVGLNPNDILREVYLYTNGLNSGSIKSSYEDNDIVLKIKEFDEGLTPEDIENLVINTKVGKIRVGDFVNYNFEKSVTSISRKDSKISITVESDLELGYNTSQVQPKFEEIAKSYNFPAGISYKSGGENQENADLISGIIMSFFIALFLIFSILVFQFNSFAQPLIVLFSVVLALLGVNIGLYITGNPYSMTFGIGFIALTGVVVNDAIILIDMINKNLSKGLGDLDSIVRAAKSRLQPIIVTTLTTVFGIWPLALQDEFWAPLGFTIIFGLITGSTMTLFSIPALYYSFFRKKRRK